MLKYTGTIETLVLLGFKSIGENKYQLQHKTTDEFKNSDYSTIIIDNNEVFLLAYDNGCENPQVLNSILSMFAFMIKNDYIVWRE